MVSAPFVDHSGQGVEYPALLNMYSRQDFSQWNQTLQQTQPGLFPVRPTVGNMTTIQPLHSYGNYEICANCNKPPRVDTYQCGR